MLKKINLLLFLLAILGFLFQVNAQPYDRKISLSTWIDEMKNNQDSIYYLTNTEIYYDEEVDTLYAWWQPRTLEEDTIPRDKIDIHSTVLLVNCKLPERSTVVLSHLIFHKNFSLTSCQGGSQVIFYNCTFHEGLDVRNSELGALQFTHSSILHRIVVSELQINLLSFSNCTLSTKASLPDIPFNYGFEQEDQPFQYLFLLRQIEKKINRLNLSNCKYQIRMSLL